MARDAERSEARGSDAKKRPLFGVGTTFAIVAVLIAPFALMTFADLEPYPAVIFPGGGSIATTLDGDVATFYADAIVGESSDGSEVRIDPAAFLDPIPPSHLGGLIATGFGQEISPFTKVDIRRTALSFRVPSHVPDEAQKRLAREWLSERLVALGLRADKLVARTERVTVDHSTGEILGRETVDEVEILD